MDATGAAARLLMVAGAVLFAAGLALRLAPQLPLGRLPGDLHFSRGRWSIELPLGTALLASVVLTLVVNLILRLRRGG